MGQFLFLSANDQMESDSCPYEIRLKYLSPTVYYFCILHYFSFELLIFYIPVLLLDSVVHYHNSYVDITFSSYR